MFRFDYKLYKSGRDLFYLVTSSNSILIILEKELLFNVRKIAFDGFKDEVVFLIL